MTTTPLSIPPGFDMYALLDPDRMRKITKSHFNPFSGMQLDNYSHDPARFHQQANAVSGLVFDAQSFIDPIHEMKLISDND